MSDDLERRLRAAHDDLPVPADDETAAARRAFLGAAPRPRVRPRRRALALVFAGLAIAGAAFGGGWAIASSAETPAKPAPHATLNAGPGFLPAQGWEVDTTGAGWTTRPPVVRASNVPLRAATDPAEATLPPNGILFEATFHPAGATSAPRRLLPLQLRQATGSGTQRRLLARVGRYDVEVVIAFGTADPPAGVLGAAAQQLGRLVAPACPSALPISSAELPRAEAFVLAWLQTHYGADPADLEGARATATLGAAMPRGGAARTACGDEVFRRTVEVDVVLPRLERVSASLSQLSYFVSRTRSGWVVWQRIH